MQTQINKGFFTKITIHVDAVFVFACTRRYAAPRSIFPIRVRFEVHLMCMAEIMWVILSIQNQSKHGWRVTLFTLLFIYRPEGSVKDQLWVKHILEQRSSFLFIENFSAAPSWRTSAYFM